MILWLQFVLLETCVVTYVHDYYCLFKQATFFVQGICNVWLYFQFKFSRNTINCWEFSPLCFGQTGGHEQLSIILIKWTDCLHDISLVTRQRCLNGKSISLGDSTIYVTPSNPWLFKVAKAHPAPAAILGVFFTWGSAVM